MKSGFEEILAAFRTLEIPTNSICGSCPAPVKQPLLPWHIGEAWFGVRRRLLVLGKNHRDVEPTRLLAQGFQDGRGTADRLHSTKPWPYWSYIREFLQSAFGEADIGWKQIARTNLVKCSPVQRGAASTDTTTDSMMEHCVTQLGAIRVELDILEPTHILALTGTGYDHVLPSLAADTRRDFVWLEARSNRIPCGRKQLSVCRFQVAHGERQIYGLRVGHPERMKKEPYVRVLVDWWNTTGLDP